MFEKMAALGGGEFVLFVGISHE